MSSEVEICNLALSHIGSGSINSLDENSIQAMYCRLKYNVVRDRCISEHTWSFSNKVEILALLDTNPQTIGKKLYKYPSDCLRINRLLFVDENNFTEYDYHSIPYEIYNFNNSKVIACNYEKIAIDYIAKITDPNLFTPDFTLALSYLLASELAIPIVGGSMGRALEKDKLQLYLNYMTSAAVKDTNENYTYPDISEYIKCRN